MAHRTTVRSLALALALLLAGCATPSPYPARYCGLVCPDMMPTEQRCEWSNCAGPATTQALWSSIFAPVPEHPHPYPGRDGLVKT